MRGLISITETFQLYGGEVVLEFSPSTHQYHALIKGRRYKVTSVTRALESLAKPALVPWAVNKTIEFIRPAITPGQEHAESYLEEVYARAKRESTRIKREAADAGTEIHRMLECYPEPPNVIPDGPVGNGYAAGVSWLSVHEVRWVHKERPIYSRRHRYSGRLDGIAEVDGVLSLVDWKSSKGMYPEYRLQTAAYIKAYEEEHPGVSIERRILIRLGKEDGAFEPHVFERDSLRKDFAAFLAALKIHTRLREIEREEKLSQKEKLRGLIS